MNPNRTLRRALRGLALAVVFVAPFAPRVAHAQVVEQGEPAAPPLPTTPVAPVEPIAIEVASPTPAPRRTDPTEVNFVAYRGDDHYTVHAGDAHCTTPCTLHLRPGATQVRVTGAAEFSPQFVVPHLASQVRLYHSAPGWYQGAGAALVPAGVGIAAGFWAFGLLCGYSSTGCYVLNYAGWPIVGVSMIITGSILLGLSNRLPPADANRAEILDARAHPRMQLTDVAFAPVDRGAAAMATFTF